MTAYMPKAKSIEWETPQDLFDRMDQEYHFTLDVCASKKNAKCKRYYNKKQDGLKQSWEGVCWMNPPYGLQIKGWVKKAYEESQKGAMVVCLLPVRSDTGWFHDYIYDEKNNTFKKGVECRLLRGRLKFGKNGKQPSTVPSMIVVFRAKHNS